MAALLVQLLDAADQPEPDFTTDPVVTLQGALRREHDRMYETLTRFATPGTDLYAAASSLHVAWVAVQYAMATHDPVKLLHAGQRYGTALMRADDALPW